MSLIKKKKQLTNIVIDLIVSSLVVLFVLVLVCFRQGRVVFSNWLFSCTAPVVYLGQTYVNPHIHPKRF